MPILGYLFYVGSALVALLFVADVYVPKQAARDEAPHTYNIPITAAQKSGAPITFSGVTRDFGPPPAMTVVDLAAGQTKSASENAQAPATQSQAQVTPGQATKAPVTVAARHEPKLVHRKVARRKVIPENSYAQIPDEWRHRYVDTGMAFARPLGW